MSSAKIVDTKSTAPSDVPQEAKHAAAKRGVGQEDVDMHDTTDELVRNLTFLELKETVCKYNVAGKVSKCKNSGCVCIHPDGVVANCKFAVKCTNAECWFRHPNAWKRPKTQTAKHHNAKQRTEALCKFGAKCTKDGCSFRHPIGGVKKTLVM